jgi:hypothetical protein
MNNSDQIKNKIEKLTQEFGELNTVTFGRCEWSFDDNGLVHDLDDLESDNYIGFLTDSLGVDYIIGDDDEEILAQLGIKNEVTKTSDFNHNGEILTFWSDGRVMDPDGCETEQTFDNPEEFIEACKNDEVTWKY